MTHDYKRHGTTTLFAALDVATGEVVHECLPAPPASGVSAVPPQDRAQRGFRTRHPRDSPTTTPPTSIRPSGRGSTNTLGSTSTSFPLHPLGSNLVERFFSELTTRQLKRLAVTSVDQLTRGDQPLHIDRRNDNPTPFVWTRLCTIHHRQGQQSERDFGYTALGTCQKKLMAEDPEYRDLRSLAGIDVS